MERMIAMRSVNFAIFGRCSLKRTPAAAVSSSRKGPPLAEPGLRSKVSIWLGPPSIHNRMHDRLRCGFVAASAASFGSQPERE